MSEAAETGFRLTEAQVERLLDCRASWEEGEGEERLERLRQREADAETLRAISRLLEETDFGAGNDLTHSQMTRLLTLVRALAPNPNLDARLLRQPDEPAALNRALRALLYSPSPPFARLRLFTLRLHAGGQTAMQFLCAVFPTEWPLVTPTGLRALALSPEQQTTALLEARLRYGVPREVKETEEMRSAPDGDSALRALSAAVVYEAARKALELSDYVEVHRLLTHGLAERPTRRQKSLSQALYAPTGRETPAGAVQEPEAPTYTPAPPEPDGVFIGTDERAPPLPDISGIMESEVLSALEADIASQGFTYPPLAIRDYYLALQTKPFALLSGLSGTGKTRLTSLFSEALTGNAAQYRLLPVRPDWTDSTPMLGYVNLLAGGGEGRFVSTPFLDFLHRAERLENAARAFFLCLDEMNLARVEHYFAEILSAMETSSRELLLPDGRALRLPANLFFTGTLNLDETTHSLSRKVLDRANVLTFLDVRLDAEEPTTESVRPQPVEASGESQQERRRPTPQERQVVFLGTRLGSVAEAKEKLRQVSPPGEDFAARIVRILTEGNALLEPHGLHFAYRVRDEALRYCAHSFDRRGHGLLCPEAPEDLDTNLRRALDCQLQQKILPRFTGTREQIESPAREMQRWAEQNGFSQTAQRLARLLARLQRDGFAAYDEA